MISLFRQEGLENEHDVTTDSSNNSQPDFDASDDDAFDAILGGDYEAADDFMNVN
jgi:hypothetical protein